jgi:hypothetical protein
MRHRRAEKTRRWGRQEICAKSWNRTKAFVKLLEDVEGELSQSALLKRVERCRSPRRGSPSTLRRLAAWIEKPGKRCGLFDAGRSLSPRG